MPEDNFDQDRHLGQVRDQEMARQTEQRRLEQERERLEQEREQQEEDERLRARSSSGSRHGASGRGGQPTSPSSQGASLLGRIRRHRAETAPSAAPQAVAEAPGHRSSSWVYALCALLVGVAALGYGTWRGTSTFGQSLRQWMGMPAIDAGLQQRTTEPTAAPEQAEAALPEPVLPSPMEQGQATGSNPQPNGPVPAAAPV